MVQLLYFHSTVLMPQIFQLLHCHITVLKLKKVQLLYCHNNFPILHIGPVTLLSQCSSYTTKRSSYGIVTVQFLYHKTVQVLYCHSVGPILQKSQLLYCHSTVPILPNGPVAVLSQYISFTTKRSIY